MKDGLIFANARAKAKEENLLHEDRLLRMMECKTLKDAVRILVEANYGGGKVIDDENDFEKLLFEEHRLVTQFVKEASPKDIGFECFFLRNDYHNLKALLKAEYGGIEDISPMIVPDGLYTLGQLKDMVESGKADIPVLQEGLNTIKKRFEVGAGNPRLIDTIIDRAMFEDIVKRLEKCDDIVKKYFKALIDTTNILSFLRAYRISGKMSFFAADFIEGGDIDIKVFQDSYQDPMNRLPLALRGMPYHEIMARLDIEDLSAFETAQDNYLLKMFSDSKSDMFSVAPIIGYYLAKLNELKVIRVVLVCIKNNVEKSEMKKRVRKLYA